MQEFFVIKVDDFLSIDQFPASLVRFFKEQKTTGDYILALDKEHEPGKALVVADQENNGQLELAEDPNDPVV